jgi:hypothetical protein
MTDTDRIAQMAYDAGLAFDSHGELLSFGSESFDQRPAIVAFARLVAEDCAKVAQSTVCDTHLPTGVRIYGTRAAQAIRARYSKEG